MSEIDSFQAWHNGKWVSWDSIRLDPMDRGVLVGDAVYEVERTFGGQLFRLEDHIERLLYSCAYTRIDPGLSKEEFCDLTRECMERNTRLIESAQEVAAWQYVSRGQGRRATDATDPNVYIRLVPIDFSSHGRFYSGGLELATSRFSNLDALNVDPRVKHVSRLHFALAEVAAAEISPNTWPLLLDQLGGVAEGPGFNVLAVRDGRLLSGVQADMLDGISRRTIIGLAESVGLTVEQKRLYPYDLLTADEVIVTATSFCMLPVSKIDGVKFKAVPGPVTSALTTAWSNMVGLDFVQQARQAI